MRLFAWILVGMLAGLAFDAANYGGIDVADPAAGAVHSLDGGDGFPPPPSWP